MSTRALGHSSTLFHAPEDFRRLLLVTALALVVHLLMLWLIPGRQNTTWSLPPWRGDHELHVVLLPLPAVAPPAAVLPGRTPPPPATHAARAASIPVVHASASLPARSGSELHSAAAPAEPSPVTTIVPAEHPAEQGDDVDDLESLKAQVRKIAANRAVTQDMPYDRLMHAPSESEKFHQAVEKARRKDCRTAYAGYALLAIPLLLENTVTGTGCAW